MGWMTTEQAPPTEIASSRLGRLELDQLSVPYVNLEDEPFLGSRIRVDETEYTYSQSFPITGHSAVMPGAVDQVQSEGKQVLVAERGKRYYLYLS